LLGGAPVRNTADSVATRVLVKGEPIEAPPGRADDFAWPRRDVITATGVLPPDPVEAEPESPAVANAAPGAEQRPRPVVRRAPTDQPRAADNGSRWGPPQQQQSFWGGWGQRQQQSQQPRSGGFFGGLFGGRW
jgi:hypothetical protein